MNTQDWSPLGWSGWISLQSKGLSRLQHNLNSTICNYNTASSIEEAEVEQFYENLYDLLELTPKKAVPFIIGDWNAKVVSQEIPGVTDKFGLGVQNEAGQRLTEFCQENALVIANTQFQQDKN